MDIQNITCLYVNTNKLTNEIKTICTMKKFYDIHMHAFDLSHPNLLAFIQRDGLLDSESITDSILKHVKWYMGLGFSLRWLFPRRIRRIIENLIQKKLIEDFMPRLENTLSIFENPIEYQFLILDYFLKHKEAIVDTNNKLKIGDVIYDKMVICPLLMDFGKTNIHYQGNVFYDETPKKPIRKQVEDVLNAIRIYYSHSLIKNDENRMTLIENNKTEDKLFEIYPFMGLNTANYSLEKLKDLFDKYFSAYENDTAASRKEKLKAKLGQFKNNLDDESRDFNYFFAGIKVYPPLGFAPWPDDSQEELEKVNYLYKMCQEKRIPIMTHCSGGGFSVLSKQKAREFTNPGKGWSEVLKNYPALKICFAHFGSLKDENNKKSRLWRNTIIDLTRDYDYVYTDFSCSSGSDYYKELNQDMKAENHTHLRDKILFGTDFSINLFANENEKSYNGYLKRYISDTHIEEDKKHQLCAYNPEIFLFDTSLSASAIKTEQEEADSIACS